MAQCAGITQKGERCRRDAREGSTVCAIHLHQEGRTSAGPADRTPWTTDDMLKAALGFGILAALALFRFRR